MWLTNISAASEDSLLAAADIPVQEAGRLYHIQDLVDHQILPAEVGHHILLAVRNLRIDQAAEHHTVDQVEAHRIGLEVGRLKYSRPVCRRRSRCYRAGA